MHAQSLLLKISLQTRSGTTTKGLKRNARKMQAYLLLAPICIESSVAVSSIFTENLFLSTRFCSKQWNRRSRTGRSGAVVASAATNNQQDHYAVLGLSSSATLADIKKAYRLLARKRNISPFNRKRVSFSLCHFIVAAMPTWENSVNVEYMEIWKDFVVSWLLYNILRHNAVICCALAFGYL
ncbi:hypothetical protein Syun_001532 [Stephania yunnanensis]|uniref:J domain-containing protein n=1 Tax=Stephania yunnanensis TaxID=152371 RepID=A0AAP0LDW7_9MAGN